jgi:hypothetical protein
MSPNLAAYLVIGLPKRRYDNHNFPKIIAIGVGIDFLLKLPGTTPIAGSLNVLLRYGEYGVITRNMK